MSKKIKDRLVRQETIDDGFTQSELNTLGECPYKWYLAYNLRVKGVEYDPNFLIGSAWHGFQENYWKSEGKIGLVPKLSQDPDAVIPQDQEAYMDLWDEKLRVLADAYIKYFSSDFDGSLGEIAFVEEEADVTIDVDGIDIRLRGKIDLGINEGLKKKMVIWDHKTAQDIGDSKSQAWQFRFQFMFYLWLQRQVMPDNPARKFVVNSVRKPSIRLKQSETIPQYVNRLTNDIDGKPESYFSRETLLLESGKMESFENEVLNPKLLKLRLICDPETPDHILKPLVLEKETSACYSIHGKWCPYIEHCNKGKEVRSFHLRNNKHPELNAQDS